MVIAPPEAGTVFVGLKGVRVRVLRIEGSKVVLWNETLKCEERNRWALLSPSNGWSRVKKERTTVFTLGLLQREHEPWRLHNFGDQPAHQPLLGIIEELGELSDAKTLDDIKDGLADTVVFMAHFSTVFGYDLDEIATCAEKLGYRPIERKAIGKLAHHYLKREQGIRGTDAEHREKMREALIEIYSILHDTANEHHVDLIEAVEQTWAHVKLRDWKKNASTGV